MLYNYKTSCCICRRKVILWWCKSIKLQVAFDRYNIWFCCVEHNEMNPLKMEGNVYKWRNGYFSINILPIPRLLDFPFFSVIDLSLTIYRQKFFCVFISYTSLSHPVFWRPRNWFLKLLCLCPYWYYYYISIPTFSIRGTRWRSWLRHCATSRKVAVSIVDGVIGIFH